MSQSLNMVHFHFTLSFRAHQLQNQVFIFPWYNLCMIFRPLDFHGNNSWFVYKTALRFQVHMVDYILHP